MVSRRRSPNKRAREIWGAEFKHHLMIAKTQCLFEPWKWLGPYLFLFVNALTLYPVNSLRLLFYRLFVRGRFIRGRDKAIHFPFEQPETLPIFLPVKYLFYSSLFCGCILIQPQRSFKVSAIESANEILWLEISLTSPIALVFRGQSCWYKINFETFCNLF